MQRLLKTCTALASCAHSSRKRARYRVLSTNADGILEVERCKACGALRTSGNGQEEWDAPELVDQLAGEIGPESFRAVGETLEAARAAAEVLHGLEALAALLPDPKFSAESLAPVTEAVRIWHEQSQRLAAMFVAVHARRKGRA